MGDWDATYPNKYRKILLVEPTGTTTAPSFKDVTVHAGGVSWYGDYLYVADTGHGMRVFNMAKILKTSTGGTADQIGRQSDTTYYAPHYAYVLPQVGTITAATTSGTALAWSTISLDRADPSIVMTEYTCSSGCTSYPNRPARAIRFKFAPGLTSFAGTRTCSGPCRKRSTIATSSRSNRPAMTADGDSAPGPAPFADGPPSYIGGARHYDEGTTSHVWSLRNLRF